MCLCRYAFKHEQQRLSVDVPTQHDTTAPTPLAYVTSDIVCGPVCDGVGQAVHSVQCSDSDSGLISVQSCAVRRVVRVVTCDDVRP